MKRLFILFVSGLFLISSCDNQVEIERESVTPVVLPYSVETMMPGSLMVTADHIIWEDPFMGDLFVRIVDKKGNELGQALRRGNGPDEMITPSYGIDSDKRFFAFDVNTNKQFVISLDSLPEAKIVERYKTNYGQFATRMIPMDGNEILVFNPTNAVPFSVRDKTTGATFYSFGTLPVEGKIENGYDYFQGSVIYNSDRDEIVYSVNRIPYMAIYKKVNGKFEKTKERALNPKDYTVKNNTFEYNGTQRGARELAVCKDYIVTVDRDRKIDSTDEGSIGRDVKKLPTTIFVYNYDLELLKIVNTGIPLIRIASDSKSNRVYAMGIETDHVLLQFDVQ